MKPRHFLKAVGVVALWTLGIFGMAALIFVPFWLFGPWGFISFGLTIGLIISYRVAAYYAEEEKHYENVRRYIDCEH